MSNKLIKESNTQKKGNKRTNKKQNKKLEFKLSDKQKKTAIGVCAAILLIAVIVFIVKIAKKDDDQMVSSNTDYEYTDVKVNDGEQLTGKYYAEIKVKDYGNIVVELDADTAPITVTNFVKLIGEKFYDGLTFHRIMENFMIQGGDPNHNGSGGSEETIKGEFEVNGVKNDLSHVRGALSMARSLENDSASSQFFIVHKDSLSLDGSYAVFGNVYGMNDKNNKYFDEGMAVVDKICKDVPTTDTNGTVKYENQPVITSIRMIKFK